MTTIAYRDGVMAADSLVGCGSSIRGETQKIYRVGKSIIAFCGPLGAGVQFVKWAKGGYKDEDRFSIAREDGFKAMIVDSKGCVSSFDDDLVAQHIDAPFHAWGSGADFALGAMAAGSSAEEAVKIAAQFDIYTGGTIRVERL